MTGPVVFDTFLVVGALAIAAMVAIALYGSGSPAPQDVVTARGYAIRRWWFWLVATVAVATFALTIPYFPYPTAAAIGRHYTIVAQQYSFTLPASVPADTPLIFDVTSSDVNHGFGIYGPHGQLVGQVQAMPDYVNHLPFEFHERGHYTVRCLEYCGIAHASMQGGFDVK